MASDPSRSSASERFALVAYGVVWYLATPLTAGYLLWRSRRQAEYRRGWGERFLGRSAGRRPEHCLWVHAVSVGETRAAAPLIEALLARHPETTVVVTHMTPTGRATAEALFGDRVRHAYLAYDYPHAVRAFLRRWRPRIGIVMETEIWPGLMAAAARARVPMVLANARLSERSLNAARRWSALMRPAASRFARILAQTDADAARFTALTEGRSPRIMAVGNVKFDLEVSAPQRELAHEFAARLGSARIVLFASTRDGEEAAIVTAWQRHGSRSTADGRRLLVVVVPRHPQRFDAVAGVMALAGMKFQRRSDGAPLADDTAAWIGDSMGELTAYYLIADVAYVGGSIAPLGGQNLIEAAAAGCPALIGPHTFNFSAASDEAVRVGAALRVADYDALIGAALALVDDADRRHRMSDAALAFAAGHRGATRRTVDCVDQILAAWGSSQDISSP